MSDRLLRRNISANYIGKLWGIASIYLFVPIYIKILGIDSYGVIGFHGVLLAMVWIMDSGLSATFSREAARSADNAYLRDLLYTIERIYLSICAATAVAVILLSGWIATRWLQAPASMPRQTLQLSIVLMGISVACQLAMSLYLGGMMGQQRQARANAVQVTYNMVRSGVVVVPLFFLPDLRTYFLWQAATSVTFLLLARSMMWQGLPSAHAPVFRWQTLSNVYRFALGMLGMAVIAAVGNQTDKLVASFMFPLSDYALYSLASLLAQAPNILTLPIALAVLPRLTALYETQDIAGVRCLYRRYSFAIAVIASTSGILLGLYCREILMLWTHDQAIASNATALVRILVAGSVCLALQLMPYHLALANGHSATNLRLGAVFLFVNPLLTIWLSHSFGLVGAAWPWLLMNAVAAAYLGRVLTVRFLPGILGDWALRDTLLPVGFCVAVGLTCRWMTDRWVPPGWNDIQPLAVAVCAIPAICGMFMLHRNVRHYRPG